MSVLLQLKAILKRWRSILSLGPVSNGEKCSQMNILRRHSRHSSLYWHAVWSPLKLQFVLSPLTISEATCPLKNSIRLTLPFREITRPFYFRQHKTHDLWRQQKFMESLSLTNTIRSPSAWSPDEPDIRFAAQLQITLTISFVNCQDVHCSKSIEKRFVFAEKVGKKLLDLKHMAALSEKVM